MMFHVTLQNAVVDSPDNVRSIPRRSLPGEDSVSSPERYSVPRQPQLSSWPTLPWPPFSKPARCTLHTVHHGTGNRSTSSYHVGRYSPVSPFQYKENILYRL